VTGPRMWPLLLVALLAPARGCEATSSNELSARDALSTLTPRLAVILLLLLLSLPGGAEEGLGVYEVLPEVVNLREGPATFFPAIGRLRRGDHVYVDRVTADWARVDVDGDGRSDGWIRFDLLAEDPSGIVEDDRDAWDADEYRIDDTTVLVLLLVVGLVSILLYMLPAIIASCRGHHNRLAIFVLNLLLGWTWFGWVVALVWALTAVDESRTRHATARR